MWRGSCGVVSCREEEADKSGESRHGSEENWAQFKLNGVGFGGGVGHCI